MHARITTPSFSHRRFRTLAKNSAKSASLRPPRKRLVLGVVSVVKSVDALRDQSHREPIATPQSQDEVQMRRCGSRIPRVSALTNSSKLSPFCSPTLGEATDGSTSTTDGAPNSPLAESQ